MLFAQIQWLYSFFFVDAFIWYRNSTFRSHDDDIKIDNTEKIFDIFFQIFFFSHLFGLLFFLCQVKKIFSVLESIQLSQKWSCGVSMAKKKASS